MAINTSNEFQQSKTHCPAGHPYTPENTIQVKSTKPGHFKRQCRKCKNLSASRRNKEKGPQADKPAARV
jgi:hypothetical protein